MPTSAPNVARSASANRLPSADSPSLARCSGRLAVARALQRRVEHDAHALGAQRSDARALALHRAFDRGVGLDVAALVADRRRAARAGVDAGAGRVARDAKVLRRPRRAPHDAPLAAVVFEVHARERAAERERLHDRDARDLVRDALMRVPGGDRVDEPRRQLAREPEYLGLGLARRQVARIVEARARAPRVRDDEHDVGPGGPQLRRLGRDRGLERRHA
jgi:hypothetical protein